MLLRNIQVEARDQTRPPRPTRHRRRSARRRPTASTSTARSRSPATSPCRQVRYKGLDNRLSPCLTDQAKDSQAVYVGTKFVLAASGDAGARSAIFCAPVLENHASRSRLT